MDAGENDGRQCGDRCLSQEGGGEQVGGHRFMVCVTSCGPITPAKTPPAMTVDSARGRRSGGTHSAAAKRNEKTTAA